MATSDTYIITRTAAQVFVDSMLLCGAIEEGETPSDGQYAILIRFANDILTQWAGPESGFAPGLRMWVRERATITLAAQNSYDLMPSGGDLDIQIPVEILSASLRNSDDEDYPLEPLLLEDYELIVDKSAVSSPAQFYYEKRIDKGVFYLNCVPEDLTDEVRIVYRQPLELISAETNELDLESYLYRALKYNLAVDVWPTFNGTTEVTNTLTFLANDSLGKAQTFYPNTTTVFFEPGKD